MDEQEGIEIELIPVEEFDPWHVPNVVVPDPAFPDITESQDAFLQNREGWYFGEHGVPTLSWLGMQPL